MAAPPNVSVRALVVGVGNYTAPGLLLENPPADARAVAATLQRLGASVTLLVDPTRSQLRDALETFSAPQVQQAEGGRGMRVLARSNSRNSAGEPKPLGLFFFAGHGIQVGGKNLLLPSDFVPPEPLGSDPAAISAMETLVRKRSVELDEVLSNLSDARFFMGVVCLDCCRTRPGFMRSLSCGGARGDGARGGLANVSAHALQADGGTLIAFATAPDRVAKDASARMPHHSPFTAALLTRLEEADVPLHNLFMRITSDVLHDTDGEQEPWVQSSLRAAAEGVRLTSSGSSPCLAPEPGRSSSSVSAAAVAATTTPLPEFLAAWKLEEYLPALSELGVSDASDLPDVAADENMMASIKFRPLHVKRFRQAAAEAAGSAAAVPAAEATAPARSSAAEDALQQQVMRLHAELDAVKTRASASTAQDGAAVAEASVAWTEETVSRARFSLRAAPLSAKGFAVELSAADANPDTVVLVSATLAIRKGCSRDDADALVRVLSTAGDLMFEEWAENDSQLGGEELATALRDDLLLWLAKVSHDLGCEGTPPTVNVLLDLGFTLQELQALGAAPLLGGLAASARVSVWPARWLPGAIGALNTQGKLPEASPVWQMLTMLRTTSLAVHVDSLADWRLHRLLNDDVRTALTSLTGFKLREVTTKVCSRTLGESLLMDDLKQQVEQPFHEAIELLFGSHWAQSLGVASVSARFAGGELVFEQEQGAASGGSVPFSLADMAAIFLLTAAYCNN